MSLKEIKSQEQYVVNELLKNGKISRNQCLQKYITRLGALIYIIKNRSNPRIYGRKKPTKLDFIGFTMPDQASV